MKRFKGFTLIELLIVVAIIAILAAIAVPNFLEAQTRSKVTRVKADLRSLSTAVEQYMLDNNQYPAHGGEDCEKSFDKKDRSVNNNDMNEEAAKDKGMKGDTSLDRLTFGIGKKASGKNRAMAQLTTPVAYIASIPNDPFADLKSAKYGYVNADDQGWILWSYGPDIDEQDKNGDIQNYLIKDCKLKKSNQPGIWTKKSTKLMAYDVRSSNPSVHLLAGCKGYKDSDLQVKIKTGAFTYDATNGSTSEGDVWRVQGQ